MLGMRISASVAWAVMFREQIAVEIVAIGADFAGTVIFRHQSARRVVGILDFFGKPRRCNDETVP